MNHKAGQFEGMPVKEARKAVVKALKDKGLLEKIDEKDLTNQLKYLEKYGVIDVTWKSNLPIITFIENRIADNYFSISNIQN